MRSSSIFIPLTTEPAGIQIAARHKSWDGGCGPEAPINHIAASRVNVDTFWGREQSPERLGLTKYPKNDTQASINSQQSLKSLYKVYAAQHSKFVRSADDGSDDGTLPPPPADHGDRDLALYMNVEPNLGFSGSVSYHGALVDWDLNNQIEDGDELGLGAFPTSAPPTQEYALSHPVLPFEWSSSDLKDPAGHYHTLPEHERKGEEALKAPSEASKGRPAGTKWLVGDGNQKYCRPFRHSHGKPKAYPHNITSGAQLDPSYLDDWNIESSGSAEDGALPSTYPESTNADPAMLLQPETRPVSHEQLVAEVKGIYGGLVMVGAESIDIDERQSVAAAQENGPGKRLGIKNDQSSVGNDEEQYLDLTSMAKARVERILRLGQQIVSSLQPILVLALALSGVSCLPTVNGSPISNSGTTSDSSDVKPLVSLLFLLENSLYVAFGAVALILTRSVAVKKGPILAWGCMIYMAAYGWWAVREDGTAPPILLVALLGFWSCSAFRYSNAIFKTFKCPERVSLMAFVLAAIFDMAIVSFMTPHGAPIPQSALLSLSLPAMSLSLHLIGCFRGQSVLPLLDRVQETESFGHEGVHLRERHCQQPRIAFEADNSRFRLLGSPLEEDSTRIWQYDN